MGMDLCYFGVKEEDIPDILDGKFFDEVGICEIYDALEIPYYKETNFAHLDRFTTSFYLLYLPEEDGYKNNRQVFTWENGKIIRNYLDGTNVKREEYMYIHLFSRPISFKAKHIQKISFMRYIQMSLKKLRKIN